MINSDFFFHEENPTEKQEWLAEEINIVTSYPLPNPATKRSYSDYISKHIDEYTKRKKDLDDYFKKMQEDLEALKITEEFCRNAGFWFTY